MNELLLTEISKEIEKTYNCKVIYIEIVQILSLCVRVKIKFNEDFLYKPFDNMPKIETICFSEKTIRFYKRVDLFECTKVNANLN